MKQLSIIHRLCVGVAFAATLSTAAQAQSADEAQKQATRLISQAISERVSRSVDLSASGIEGDAARRSLWALGSYSDLGFSGSHLADLYLGVGGYDKSFGDTVIGVSGSYARAEFGSFGGFGLGHVDTLTVSPYGAIKLNPNVFLSGIVNLSYSAIPNFDDSINVGTEAALNAFTKTDKVVLRGKVAYRGGAGLDPSSDWQSTFLVFGEAETKASDKISVYANVEADWAIIENGDDFHPIYGGVGAYIRPNDRSQLGLGYQRLFNGDGLEISTFTVQYRKVF